MTEPNPKRRVLFVDDDPEFLRMIERVLRVWSKDSWQILTAPGASGAMAILQDQPVDLVVIDVCMPVVDGLQFLSILSRRHPDLCKVVLTGYATETYRTACLSNGAELFLEKPRTSDGFESIFATLDELSRFKPEPGFRGVLRRVGLLDVIQLECLGRSNSLLAVSGGGASGAIYIKEGSIIHAEAGPLKGRDAFYKLLGLSSGDFRLNPFAEPPEITINEPWEGLLMDAAQRRDEAEGEAAERAPSPRAAAPSPATPAKTPGAAKPAARTEELLICSEAGDVLHSWQCLNTDLRISLLEFVSQKARILQQALPLGAFDRVIFESPSSRLIARVHAEHGVILRTASGASADAAEPSRSRPASAAAKALAEEWFRSRLDLPGLLAAAIQFADRTGASHAASPMFSPDGLDALRRCVVDAFQVLKLQRFAGARARWLFDETAIESARWPDGTCLMLVLARQTLELDPASVDQHFEAFLAEGEARH